MSPTSTASFRKVVWNHYTLHGRDLPWRHDVRPYAIVVSELMLQQTQVPRVVPKFNSFLQTFPDFTTLSQAPLSDVLRQWMGLGYNRRARFVHELAQKVVTEHGGMLPSEQQALEALPGVGTNTAGAIRAYAFNQPALFVETNIRTVYIHHFFQSSETISDTDIKQLVTATLDVSRPREWYWALMDYGSFLKTSHNNISRSQGYKKQSVFSGSIRQMRGEIMRQLSQGGLPAKQLDQLLEHDVRLEPALRGLLRDGLIEHDNSRFYLTGQDRLR